MRKEGTILSEAILQKILSEITGLKDGMGSVTSEVSGLKNEMSSVKSEVNSLKVETNKRLDAIEKKQQLIYNQTGNLTAYHTETMTEIRQLQKDVELTYQKTALHDLQINRLENTPPQN